MMMKKLLIPAVLALAVGSVALAQDHGGRDSNWQRGDSTQRDNDHRDEGRRDEMRHDEMRRDDGHRDDGRRDDNRAGYRGDERRADNRGYDNHGAGPRHDLYRGGRLPTQYRNRQYVVDNWREHRLSAPPRGYQWVQTGSDYVLVAAATGLIAQILLNQ